LFFYKTNKKKIRKKYTEVANKIYEKNGGESSLLQERTSRVLNYIGLTKPKTCEKKSKAFDQLNNINQTKKLAGHSAMCFD